MKKYFFIAFTFQVSTILCQVNPYLPEIFQRLPNVRDLAITSDQREVYFTVESFKKEFSCICVIKKSEEGNWQHVEVASFSGQYKDLEPALSSDGLRLYFSSARPLTPIEKQSKDFDIWYVERKDLQSPWGNPINIGSNINTEKDEFYPSIANSGNIYFTRMSNNKQKKEDIFISTFTNNSYATPAPLSDSINGNTYEYNAYIAPDESFIIFTSYGRKDDLGGSDLYISKKNKDGIWLGAKNMTENNSNKIDYCPFVQNNTLYFTSERSTVSKELPSPKLFKEIMGEMYQYSNGMSRIYMNSLNIERYFK